MTLGLEVLVQEVIAAIATAPSDNWYVSPFSASTSTVVTRFFGSPVAGASEAGKDSFEASSTCKLSLSCASSLRKARCSTDNGTRSCGRLGPAIEATTVDIANAKYSDRAGS